MNKEIFLIIIQLQRDEKDQLMIYFFSKSKLYIMMQWIMIDFKMQFYETDFFLNISEKRFKKCKTIYKFGNKFQHAICSLLTY